MAGISIVERQCRVGIVAGIARRFSVGKDVSRILASVLYSGAARGHANGCCIGRSV